MKEHQIRKYTKSICHFGPYFIYLFIFKYISFIFAPSQRKSAKDEIADIKTNIRGREETSGRIVGKEMKR